MKNLILKNQNIHKVNIKKKRKNNLTLEIQNGNMQKGKQKKKTI